MSQGCSSCGCGSGCNAPNDQPANGSGSSCADVQGGCGGCGGGVGPQAPGAPQGGAQLSRLGHKLVVMSGKGGVGKSTMAANIALGLSREGKKVGLLDVDLHGPSIPRLLSLTGSTPRTDRGCLEPVWLNANLGVMSIGFLLPGPDQAVIWRGPVKMGLIGQFVEEVAWGDLDYLVVDCPPGTGDEPLSVLQHLGSGTLAILVTSPQALATDDVRRSVSFCRELGVEVLGLVENLSGFICPDCGQRHDIFSTGGGESLARETGIPFLGRIPIDPELARSGDEGYTLLKVAPESETSRAMHSILAPLLALDERS